MSLLIFIYFVSDLTSKNKHPAATVPLCYFNSSHTLTIANNTMFQRMAALFLLATLISYTLAFVSPPSTPHHAHATHRISELYAEGEAFEVMVDLPGEGLSAKMKFKPVLEDSEIVEVRYQVRPFE